MQGETDMIDNLIEYARDLIGDASKIKAEWAVDSVRALNLAEFVYKTNPHVEALTVLKTKFVFNSVERAHAVTVLLPIVLDNAFGLDQSTLIHTRLHAIIKAARSYHEESLVFAGIISYDNINVNHSDISERDLANMRSSGLSPNPLILQASFYGYWDNNPIITERCYAVDYQENNLRYPMLNAVELYDIDKTSVDVAAQYFEWSMVDLIETNCSEEEHIEIVRDMEKEIEPITIYLDTLFKAVGLQKLN